MKTRAMVCHAPGAPLVEEELDLAPPGPGEVLIEIMASGLCHTDLMCRDQEYPLTFPAVFGHEGSGIVEKVGSKVTKLQAGDHVVLSYRACGHCPACKRGDPTHCANIFGCNFAGVRADGSPTVTRDGNALYANFFNQSSFATYAIASEANTVKVSKEAPLEYLGPLGCGIQTGAGAVINSLQPPAGSSIAVFGCGSVGLAAIMAAKAVGCTMIIGVDPMESRRNMALELGATHVVDPTKGSSVEQVQKISGSGVDYSLECTAKPAVFRQAVDSLTVPGVCGLVGAAPLGTEVTLDMNSIMFGRTVFGIIEGGAVPDLFIPKLVELYRQGLLPLEKIVKFYSLDEIDQAVHDSESGKVVKAILRP